MNILYVEKKLIVNVLGKVCLFLSNLINWEMDIFFLNCFIVNFNLLIIYLGMYIYVLCGYYDWVFVFSVCLCMMYMGFCSEIFKLVKIFM